MRVILVLCKIHPIRVLSPGGGIARMGREASKSWLYHFTYLSLKKSLESSFRAGDHLGCIPAVQQSQCFFELLSHKYATETIKGWEVGVWPPLNAQPVSVRFLCNEMAAATLSFHAGVRKLPWWYPSCVVLELSSLFSVCPAAPDSTSKRLSEKSFCWAIWGNECSCLFTKQQHWATCAGSLCNNPRFPHVLSGVLYLKIILYWNKPVVCRNYCSDPRRNHKLETWISDCLQLNTHNGSILRQLAFVKLITVYVYHSVLWGTIKTLCVTQGKGHRNQIQNICIASCSQGSQHGKGGLGCWDFGGVGVAVPQNWHHERHLYLWCL